MNKTHRILSILLASIVFLSGVDLTPLFSNAAVNYETATFYVIDVAVQYDSSNSGMKSDISVSYTLPSNYEPLRGARNIQIKDRAALYDFDSPQHGMEMKDNEYILKSTDWSNFDFRRIYEPFISSRLSFTQQIQLSGTTFSYKYSASKAYAAYSGMDANRLEAYSFLREQGVTAFKNTLFNHNGQIRLLGDETAYARDYRENYDTIKDAIDNYNKPAYADRKLYITFQPTIFSFTCEVPREYSNGTLKAALTAPSSVKVGRDFTVSDATTLSDDLRYERGVLERKIGSGSFETIATWNGPASRGVNSGESKEENIDSPGQVTYRLTVTASGKTDTCEKVVNVVQKVSSSDYNMNFGWEINPKITYEGHPIIVKDTTDFIEHTTEEDDEGNTHSVTNYYSIYDREGGSHSYSTTSTDYSQNQINRANTEFRFWTKGTYDISVEEYYHGCEDYDTDSVEILKTPTIVSHSLTGQQKQNRKQIISADIALNPRYPMVDWEIAIKDKNTGETARLSPSIPKVEMPNIKTRAVKVTTDVDGCYTHLYVEFLTKNPSFNKALGQGTGSNSDGSEPFEYEIFVRDARGNNDRVAKNFDVIPDVPPTSIIGIEDYFIRNAGTNTANITAEDISIGDGDEISRIWYATGDRDLNAGGEFIQSDSLANFKNAAFGSDQKVKWDKNGVGKVKVKLFIREEWGDELTLAEYISDADHLTSSAIAETEVTNVAPHVALEPLDIIKASVYLYDNTADGTMDRAVKETLNSLKALSKDMLSEGIYMDIKDVSRNEYFSGVSGRASVNSKPYVNEVFYIELPRVATDTIRDDSNNLSYKSEVWEDGGYSLDDEIIYILNPNVIYEEYLRSKYPKYICPFTISAYRISDTQLLWTKTITEDMWGAMDNVFAGNTGGASIRTGGPVKYNFSNYYLLSTKESTIVIQKNNGATVTTLPIVAEDYAWQSGENLYLYKKDGLYRVNTANGDIKCVYSGSLCEHPRLLRGRIWFVDATRSGFLVKFDMDSESFERAAFYGDMDISGLKCLGIDSEGKIALSDVYHLYVYKAPEEKPSFVGGVTWALQSHDYACYWQPAAGAAVDNHLEPFIVHNSKDVIEYIGYGGNYTNEYTSRRGVSSLYNGDQFYQLYNAVTGEEVIPYTRESVRNLDFRFSTVAWDTGDSIVVETGNALCNNPSTLWVNKRNKTVSFSAQDECNYEPLGKNVSNVRYAEPYIISVSPAISSETRKISVRTLPCSKSGNITPISQNEIDNIATLSEIKEKEPEYDKAIILSIRELASEVRGKLSDLGRNIYSGGISAIESLKSYFAEKSQDANSIKVNRFAEVANSTLTRNIPLNPQKEYFYEYSIVEDGVTSSTANALSVKENIRSYSEENNLSYINANVGYVVTGAEIEDYTSKNLNPFFRYSNGARGDDSSASAPYWNFGYSSTDKSWGNGSGGTISFTVPENKEAVLYVKYKMDQSRDGNTRSHRQSGGGYVHYKFSVFSFLNATLDGVRMAGKASPTFVRTPDDGYEGEFGPDGRILGPGEHSITLRTWEDNKLYSQGSLLISEIAVYYVEASNYIETKVYDSGVGETKTYVIPEDGRYTLILRGPANNTKSSKGGRVKGTVNLKKGDVLTYYMGSHAQKGGTGQPGMNGSGYGDNGIYKSTLSINGKLVMVAGGAGGDGGDGTIETISYNDYRLNYNTNYAVADTVNDTPTCPKCGSTNCWSRGRPRDAYTCSRCNWNFNFSPGTAPGHDYTCYCGYHVDKPSSGTAGYHQHLSGNSAAPVGGRGGAGGYTYIVGGAAGTPASAFHWGETGASNPLYSLPVSYYYPATTVSGNGGSGGKSWIDGSVFTNTEITGGGGLWDASLEVCKSYNENSIWDSNISSNETIYVGSGAKVGNGRFKTSPTVLTYSHFPGASTFFGSGISEFYDKLAPTYYVNSWREDKSNQYGITYTIQFNGEITQSEVFLRAGKTGSEIVCPGKYILAETYTSDMGYLHEMNFRQENINTYICWGQATRAGGDMPIGDFVVTAVPYGQSNSNVVAQKYIANGVISREAPGNVFLEDKTWDGSTTITLQSSAPTWYLTSFSLYYLENGKKVYVINEEQMGKDKLKNWEVSGGTKSFAVYSAEPVEEDPALIYKKGEYVAQKVNYSDYEADPLKKGYWIYAHQPFNDGAHAKAGIVLNDDEQVIRVGGTSVAPGSLTIEQAAERLRSLGNSSYILTEPINRFYEDGKYHALYYAYDDTSRGATPGGNPNYDKASNIAEIVFYIIGESSTAPYIKAIKTSPAVVVEDENAKILTEVGDAEGDTLSLTVELFRDSEQILRQKWTGLTPNAAGEYPIKTTNNFTCDAGAYTVIATVRDATGVGAGTYKFKVGAAGKIEGMVSHTEKWEKNRTAYNNAKFSRKYTTAISLSDYNRITGTKPHYTNVFWSGEKLILKADTQGKVQSVKVKLYKWQNNKWIDTGITSTLTAGVKTGKVTPYTGSMYDSKFKTYGLNAPQGLKLEFTAYYSGSKTKVSEVEIIMDGTDPYQINALKRYN